MLLDLIGAFTSLLATYYFIRLDKKAWLVTLLATCLNGFLYWQNGIYADMVLESCYFFSTCYGWFLWRKPLKQETFLIISLSKRQWLFIIVSATCFFLIIKTLLSTLTNSNIAILDALTTSLSLVAQWLMCHKAIETWFFWFFIDALYAYMYFHKLLPFHSLLMLLYTGMAVAGYLTWARRSRPSQPRKHPYLASWIARIRRSRNPGVSCPSQEP